MILEDSLNPQYRLLIFDIGLRKSIINSRVKVCSRIKWWNFKGDKVLEFPNKFQEVAPYNLDSDINCMWNLIVDCIRMVTTEYLRGLNVDYLKQTIVIDRIDGVLKMFLMKLRLRKIL